jgi:hypothetical protein
MASAMHFADSVSPLAEMVPTCAIALRCWKQGFDSFFSSARLRGLVDAALQVHRVHAGGNRLQAFAQDGLRQHGRGGGAVAGQIVGGLEATSFTICAPMFSNLSSSSTSLATVTPSLVTRRARRRTSGDHVAALRAQRDLTAFASVSTPFSIFWRASAENFTSLAAIVSDSFNK